MNNILKGILATGILISTPVIGGYTGTFFGSLPPREEAELYRGRYEAYTRTWEYKPRKLLGTLIGTGLGFLAGSIGFLALMDNEKKDSLEERLNEEPDSSNSDDSENNEQYWDSSFSGGGGSYH